MPGYSRSQLSDGALLRTLHERVAKDRVSTAELLADLGEVGSRKLYLPAGYPSMFAYCVGHLRMSEDVTYKRLQAARAARRFPSIFEAVADGRLHLTGVVRLAPHLTRENARELLASAAHLSKSQLEKLLAERFPQPDLPELVRPLPAALTTVAGAVGPALTTHSATESTRSLVPEPVHSCPQVVANPSSVSAPARIAPVVQSGRSTPLSPGRFALQVTLSQEAHEDLLYAKALLGHAVPMGELSEVVSRALKLLVQHLERRRFAACAQGRPARQCNGAARTVENPRHIPAHVRREVWLRDGGRCTFVGEGGHRCEGRTRLELDHVTPVAKGGASTVANLRVRCRNHNLFEASRLLGESFMQGKIERAQRHATGKP